MKNLKKLATIITVLAMAFVMAIPTFAAYKQNISLPKNQTWITAGDATRNQSFSTVSARCDSVYPDSGADFFGKIQCQVTNNDGTIISDKVYTLDEGASDYTKITIKEGYLSTSSVNFQFRGNTSAAANAVVSYNG